MELEITKIWEMVGHGYWRATHIYYEKQSGKDFNRPKYQSLKAAIRRGDLIYIDALDRLGRNYDGIITEWKCITHELNADIIILENES